MCVFNSIDLVPGEGSKEKEMQFTIVLKNKFDIPLSKSTRSFLAFLFLSEILFFSFRFRFSFSFLEIAPVLRIEATVSGGLAKAQRKWENACYIRLVKDVKPPAAVLSQDSRWTAYSDSGEPLLPDWPTPDHQITLAPREVREMTLQCKFGSTRKATEEIFV